MLTKWLLMAPVAGAVGVGVVAGVGADKLQRSGARRSETRREASGDAADHPRCPLQQRRRLLLARGEVVDDARVDFTFPEQDINDLLKSMVLEDFNDGRIAAVTYDSREPISRTLSSFAVNLTGNPTFAGIVSQMRGETSGCGPHSRVPTQPGKLSGVIVGVSSRR